jgi:anthranilate synthase component II
LIIVIDNYDSFTYNLVQYLGELASDFPVAEDLQISRNDKISLEQVKVLKPDAIVISPGPGRPEDAGISMELIRELGSSTPILGVCLGHQSSGGQLNKQLNPHPKILR